MATAITLATGEYLVFVDVPGTYQIVVEHHSTPEQNFIMIINPIIADLAMTGDTVQNIVLPDLVTLSDKTTDSNGVLVGNAHLNVSIDCCYDNVITITGLSFLRPKIINNLFMRANKMGKNIARNEQYFQTRKILSLSNNPQLNWYENCKTYI